MWLLYTSELDNRIIVLGAVKRELMFGQVERYLCKMPGSGMKIVIMFLSILTSCKAKKKGRILLILVLVKDIVISYNLYVRR